MNVLNQKELNTSHFSMKFCVSPAYLSLFMIDMNFNILFGDKMKKT